jgi:hypothetical protein
LKYFEPLLIECSHAADVAGKVAFFHEEGESGWINNRRIAVDAGPGMFEEIDEAGRYNQIAKAE